MIKKLLTGSLLAALCLVLLLSPAPAETRQGVIMLEGTEEAVEEMLFESPQGFSFWYVLDRLKADPGQKDNIDGVIVSSLYADDYMVLSMIPEEDAKEYAANLDENIIGQSAASRVEADVYRELKNGTFSFLTLIAEKGHYLMAVGEYSEEAAEGTAKFFQRVLDSVSFASGEDVQAPAADSELLPLLPGEWAEENDGAGMILILEEDGSMSLSCYSTDGAYAYTFRGVWSLEAVTYYDARLTLLFTSTDDPKRAGTDYRVECVYEAYSESWIENDTLITYLLLNPPVSCTGVSPFEEVSGDNSAALHKEQGPNMRVVNCKEYVSLRAERSKTSKRLAKVPLGALVLAFPENGTKNGFIYCVYHDTEGFILAEYLRPID